MGAETQKFVCCVCQCHDMSCCVLEWCVQKCICMRTYAGVQFQMCKYMTMFVRIYIYTRMYWVYIYIIIRMCIILYVIIHSIVCICIYNVFLCICKCKHIWYGSDTEQWFLQSQIGNSVSTGHSLLNLRSLELRVPRLPHWWVWSPRIEIGCWKWIQVVLVVSCSWECWIQVCMVS